MTTEPIDPYAVLGVARNATQAQISGAYRTLLRRYHPDTRAAADSCSDARADAALQHVLTAYAILADPGRRRVYDQQTSPQSAHPPSQPGPPRRPPTPRIDDPPLRAGPVHWTPWPTTTTPHADP